MMHHVDCETALRELWAFLDEELTVDNRAAIQQHLEHCHHCRPIVAFHRAFLQALERVGTMPVSQSLRQQVLDTLQREGLQDPRTTP